MTLDAAIEDARALIRKGLQASKRPYIALSGGKDSLVTWHLVDQIDNSIPLVYADDELLFPEHVAYMRHLKDGLGDRLRIVQGGGRHRWFVPWAQPPAWRAPEPEMEWLHWQSPRMTAGQFAARLGYDGVILGLRRAESLRRADILDDAVGSDRLGAIQYINPLIGWSDVDVWAYITQEHLDFCAVYDRLAAQGVDIHHQRVGPLPLTPGKQIWRGWPDLYVALIRRYGLRWTHPGRRRPHDMDPLIWLDIQSILKNNRMG